MPQRREEALRLSAVAAAAGAMASAVAVGAYILHLLLYLFGIGYQDGVLTFCSATTAISTAVAATLLLFSGLEVRSRHYRRALFLATTAAAVLAALYVYFHLYIRIVLAATLPQLTAELGPWPILLPVPAALAAGLDALLALLFPRRGPRERPSHVV